MKTTSMLAGSLVSMILVACGSNTADLYQAPPSDGSVAANSADVVDNPPITPNSPNLSAPPADTYTAPPNDGSVAANSADVVDNPSMTTATECLDPITKEPVVGSSHVGYYGQWQLRFISADTAAQFAALPRAKRNKLGAAQVLPQKGIRNSVCPLTGETLTAQAAPVTWDGKIIGFATGADANRFRLMNKDKQSKIMTTWIDAGSK